MDVTTLHSVGLGVSWLVNVLLRIAVLAVVVAVVRRHRPEASAPLVVWSVMELVWSVFGQALFYAASWFAGRGGVESLVTAQLGATAVSTVIHIAMTVLLVYALVRLAKAPAVRPPSPAVHGAV